MLEKMLRLAPVALAVLAAGARGQTESQAPAAGDSPFSFSGFATVGAVSTNTSQAQYVISGEPRGATTRVSGEVDSKIGAQLNAKLNAMFSGTVQVLSKENGDGNFRPEVEWAFAKAQLTPALSARVGRMGGPFFAVSDFRDVGYANLWLRPPQDVYGQVPVSHFDGADLSWQASLGSATLTAQFFGGQSRAVFEHIDVRFKRLIGLNLTAELENGLSLRFGRAQGRLTVESAELNQLVSVLQSTPFAAVGKELSALDKAASFTGIGLSYDQHNIIVSAEYTQRRTEAYVPDTTGWYATVGYRFGKLAPYVTVSQLKQDSSNVGNTIPLGASAGLDQLKATVDGVLLSQSNEQKTVALGLRWDAWRNVALKAQIDRISPNGPGLFASPKAGFGQDSVNVYSLAADFVF